METITEEKAVIATHSGSVGKYYVLEDLKPKTTGENSLYDMLTAMFGGTYGVVVGVSKKGFNLLRTFDLLAKQDDTEVAPRLRDDVFLCSDKLLGNPEFIRVIKERASSNKRLCIFDDSIRLGRRLSEVLDSVYQICKEEGLSGIEVDIFSIIQHKAFNVKVFEGNNFDGIITVCDVKTIYKGEHSEMQAFSQKTLRTLYQYRYLYSVAAPKSAMVLVDERVIESEFCGVGLSEISDEETLRVLEGIDVKIYEKFKSEEDLYLAFSDKCPAGSDVLAKFIKNASVETYYSSNDEQRGHLQTVARASISRMSENVLDKILCGVVKRYANGFALEELSDINGSVAELKYEVLNYILSVLSAHVLLDSKWCDFDAEDMKFHYGVACEKMLRAVYVAFKKDALSELSFIAMLFTEVHLGIKKSLSVKAKYADAYEKFLSDIFSTSNDKASVSNYSTLRSVIDMQDIEFDIESRSQFYYNEIPVCSLVDFICKRGDNAVLSATRKESVFHQIAGRLTISTRTVEIDGERYLEKYAKVGELAALLRPFASLVIDSLSNVSGKLTEIKVDTRRAAKDVVVCKVENIYEDLNKLYREVIGGESSVRMVNLLVDSGGSVVVGDTDYSNFVEGLVDLFCDKMNTLREKAMGFIGGVYLDWKYKEIFGPFETPLMGRLANLSTDDKTFIDDLFWGSKKVEYSIDSNLRDRCLPGREYFQNTSFDLGNNTRLVIRVCVCAEEGTHGKFEWFALPPKDKFAKVYENFDEGCIEQFNNAVKEFYISKLFGD